MSHRVLVSALIAVASLAVATIGCSSEAPPPAETMLSAEERLAWFKHDKFGMFVHWGPYSVLAGEWNDRRVEVGDIAEWIMHRLEIHVVEYREMAREFNPVDFDARSIVKLAKDAGMKYIVFTSKHHDGFAMYRSKVSGYNIVDWTEFDRDPIAELAEDLGRAPDSLYYHMRVLQRVGLVVPRGTRGEGVREEALYATPGVRM